MANNQLKISMKKLLITLSLFVFVTVSGQTKYGIDGFSKDYKAILKLYNKVDNEVSNEGEITIVDKKTNKTVLKVPSDYFSIDQEAKGKVSANLVELPYDKQSILSCQDFNFDGKEDLAIMDGQKSCYGGPSYQIYLYDKGTLKYSVKFTVLSQSYCGMFTVNTAAKTLQTMTKSGCCWHQYTTFKVEKNIPVAVKIIEESLNPNGIMFDYLEKNKVGAKMLETTYSMLPESGLDYKVLFSFTLNDDKKMSLIQSFTNKLYYTFTDKEGKIELYYADIFKYNKNSQTLWFRNKDIKYTINKDGILVTLPDKRVELKALDASKKGAFNAILKIKFDNLIME